VQGQVDRTLARALVSVMNDAESKLGHVLVVLGLMLLAYGPVFYGVTVGGLHFTLNSLAGSPFAALLAIFSGLLGGEHLLNHYTSLYSTCGIYPLTLPRRSRLLPHMANFAARVLQVPVHKLMTTHMVLRRFLSLWFRRGRRD